MPFDYSTLASSQGDKGRGASKECSNVGARCCPLRMEGRQLRIVFRCGRRVKEAGW